MVVTLVHFDCWKSALNISNLFFPVGVTLLVSFRMGIFIHLPYIFLCTISNSLSSLTR
uniref:Uncharacterized protein n=1 Tax=Arundo donax TaxID=35708 RepID=A0A0A9GJX9_ARUDO